MKPAMGTAVHRHARHLQGFEERVARSLAQLQEAAAAHAGRVVQTTSLGAEDMVITDLIARHRLPIALATLDTGLLHAQTLALAERLQSHYGMALERWQPMQEQVLSFTARHGANAMYASPAQRQACCALRKLEPLARALQGRSAWITGLRREQSAQRQALPFSQTDDQGRQKFNPLADWLETDVWHYIGVHAVPYNPLHDAFFPSIGCAPCTRAVALGEDPRSGRWWWEQDATKECGLHLRAGSQAISNTPA